MGRRREKFTSTNEEKHADTSRRIGHFLSLFALWTALAVLPPPLPGQPDVLSSLDFERVAGGIPSPVAITHAGDGSGRLFVIQQSGRIRIVQGSQLLPAPFLDISHRVSCCGEQGLLSAAFHPHFETNGFFFVNYTNTAGNTVVSRFSVSANPNSSDPASEVILLTVQQPFSNHNGGQLQFGPDGFLYIATGDGGSGGDPGNRAQNLGTLLGKILRIDVNSGNPYSVPPGNPFVNTPSARPEIWAYGLRNPWRFSFDRQTGDMFIGDVGQNAVEEINFQPASSGGGENYGWRRMEGRQCFDPPTGCQDPSFTAPILQYTHTGGNCSVTGGYRYRGRQFPQLWGIYFYGDYCSGRLYAANDDSGAWRAENPRSTGFLISTFGEDEAGELYVANYSAGVVYRVVSTAPQPSAPLISEGGVVEAAGYSAGTGIAPGSIAAVFGLNLSSSEQAALSTPLPDSLGGATLRFLFGGVSGGGVGAAFAVAPPIFFASPGQINIQVPWELTGSETMLQDIVRGQASNFVTVPLAPFSPGIFTMNGTGAGQGAIVIVGTGGAVAAPVGAFSQLPSRPVRRGESLAIFANGLGPVSNRPATGEAALAEPLSETETTPAVTIGGVSQTVTFSGLSPDAVGLYQVNVDVAAETPSGGQVTLKLTIGEEGKESNTVTVAVE
jgi:uncharacterized protein (TIGR03437 family)